MNSTIADKTSLLLIQKAFSEVFPLLQIRFYHKSYNSDCSYSDADRIVETAGSGDIRHTHTSGVVEVYPFLKVAATEKEF